MFLIRRRRSSDDLRKYVSVKLKMSLTRVLAPRRALSLATQPWGPVPALLTPSRRTCTSKMYIAEERGSPYSPDYRIYFSEYIFFTDISVIHHIFYRDMNNFRQLQCYRSRELKKMPIDLKPRRIDWR